MENGELITHTGKDFIFHIMKEDEQLLIALSSKYVYPPVDKFELKKLADFIYKIIE
jgi:hypothetical protein